MAAESRQVSQLSYCKTDLVRLSSPYHLTVCTARLLLLPPLPFLLKHLFSNPNCDNTGIRHAMPAALGLWSAFTQRPSYKKTTAGLTGDNKGIASAQLLGGGPEEYPKVMNFRPS